LLRLYALSGAGVLPQSLKEGMQRLPNFSGWAESVMGQESVRQIWDERDVVERTKARLQKMREQKK